MRPGKPVFIMGDAQSRDYTPDHAATRRVRRLLETGAQTVSGIPDLLKRLPATSG
jgi:hypothetical protein